MFQISHIPFSVRLLNTQRKNCIPEGIRHWFVEQLGVKVVKIVCLLELKGLHGRDRLTSCPTEAVVSYEGK